MKQKPEDLRRKLIKALEPFGERSAKVADLLYNIHGCQWFSRAGLPHPRDFYIERVASWDEAFHAAADKFTEKVTLPHWRKLSRLAGTDEQIDRLCDLDREARGLFLENEGLLVGSMSKAVREGRTMPLDFTTPVPIRSGYWSLSHIVGLTACALYMNEPATFLFFSHLLGFYVEGYWPCGWSGKYPQGRLIVF